MRRRKKKEGEDVCPRSVVYEDPPLCHNLEEQDQDEENEAGITTEDCATSNGTDTNTLACNLSSTSTGS